MRNMPAECRGSMARPGRNCGKSAYGVRERNMGKKRRPPESGSLRPYTAGGGLHLPGGAGPQQIVDAPDFGRGPDLLDLPFDGQVVDRIVLDGPDDAHGHRIVGVFHRGEHRVKRRVALVGVVRQHIVERVAVLANGHHLELHVLEDETLFVVGAEEHLLAVAQRDRTLGARGLVGRKGGMGLVVEDHAVLQYFHDRHAAVQRGGHHALLGEVDLHVDRAGEEGALGADDQLAGVERLLDGAVGRRLGDLAQLRGGRVLSLGQAVDLVVEEDDVQIDVAADGVDEVVAADGQRVAVACRDPHVEPRIGHLDARGHGIGAAVDRVEAEGLHVVDEARRTADARDEREEVVRRVGAVGHFGQGALHGIEDGLSLIHI